MPEKGIRWTGGSLGAIITILFLLFATTNLIWATPAEEIEEVELITAPRDGQEFVAVHTHIVPSDRSDLVPEDMEFL